MLRELFVAGAAFLSLGVGVAHSADRVYGASFETISSAVRQAGDAQGATGAALILGAGDAVFFAESVGAAGMEAPLMLPSHADMLQSTLVLALFDQGRIDLDAQVATYLPKLGSENSLQVRDLIYAHANASPSRAQMATQLLIKAAEAAAGTDWNDLVVSEIADPSGLRHTLYPTSLAKYATLSDAQPNGLVHTTARDYARLMSLYANGGVVEGVEVISPEAIDLALDYSLLGVRMCRTPQPHGSCAGFENAAPGLYAFVDKERALYGVLITPGADQSPRSEGRLIRDLAIAITDQNLKPMGLTAATGQ